MTEWWQNLSWSEAAGWACMGFVALLAIYGALIQRPRRRNLNRYKPRPDSRDTRQEWDRIWRV